MTGPVLPALDRTALLLDLDGTLIDIAPTPDSVVVEPGLVATLRDLAASLSGALAVVSGRPIDVVDRLLQDAPHAVAGEHGAAIRHAPHAAVERPDLPAPPDAWLQRADAMIAAHPGAVMERKARGFTMHFRGAPDAGPRFHDLLQGLLAGQTVFQLLGGSMVWEVRPAGADKGRAVRMLMRRAPFAGRVPVFIGDDVTDEDGMRVARAMGGLGLRVDACFGTPAGVRAWLAGAAARGAWPALPKG